MDAVEEASLHGVQSRGPGLHWLLSLWEFAVGDRQRAADVPVVQQCELNRCHWAPIFEKQRYRRVAISRYATSFGSMDEAKRGRRQTGFSQDAYGICVRRNARVRPPTVPVPVICPLLLIPVAIFKTQPDSMGISVFRSVSTPFCQMNARPELGSLLT